MTTRRTGRSRSFREIDRAPERSPTSGTTRTEEPSSSLKELKSLRTLRRARPEARGQGHRGGRRPDRDGRGGRRRRPRGGRGRHRGPVHGRAGRVLDELEFKVMLGGPTTTSARRVPPDQRPGAGGARRVRLGRRCCCACTLRWGGGPKSFDVEEVELIARERGRHSRGATIKPSDGAVRVRATSRPRPACTASSGSRPFDAQSAAPDRVRLGRRDAGRSTTTSTWRSTTSDVRDRHDARGRRRRTARQQDRVCCPDHAPARPA